MTAHDDFDDIWTQRTSTTEQHPEPLLQVETIDGVEPLDDQFGVDQPATVPDALYEPLFGQPDTTGVTLATAGNDLDKVPPLQTYAILDAAKVVSLPEMLEASGLEHRCLFKGAAYDEMKNVAPWIVRLEEGNSFTRNLFTRSDVPWHMWDSELGIYLRSTRTLDDIWKHFRKFTRVQDEDEKWFYFRFWEPNAFVELVTHPDSARLLTPPNGCVFHSFYASTKDVTYAITPPEPMLDKAKPFKLTTGHRVSFDASVESRFARDFAVSLVRTAPVRSSVLGVEGHDALAQMVTRIIEYLKPLGFTKRSDLGRMASCALFYGTHFLHDPRIAGLSQYHLTDTKLASGLRAKRFEEALHKAVPLDTMTGAAGITKLLSHLRFAFERKGITQDHLIEVYTPEFGFHDADTVQRFIQTCQARQQAKALDDFERQMAHYTLSALYTPYFLDDPLQERLIDIFGDTSKFEEHLLSEIEHRIAVLKEN
ncbi:DUF4123 domain-containing protein [Yoonia maritima]|uniref:DUF4123 domain-containing protein n=1 Tax=Yoonia maritima TaxID=1435347 RepID=UPI000D0F4D51|nr:DUF4123 domain-containing protein [Yoonia maritima]